MISYCHITRFSFPFCMSFKVNLDRRGKKKNYPRVNEIETLFICLFGLYIEVQTKNGKKVGNSLRDKSPNLRITTKNAGKTR